MWLPQGGHSRLYPIGLLRFTPEACEWVETLLDGLAPRDQDRIDITALLRALIESGRPLAGIPSTCSWGEVDSEADLAAYREEPMQNP